MVKDQLKKLVDEKIDAAFKSSEHPKKFFITENGRGVVDGGELYNAVLKDVLGVVKVALVDILEEALKSTTLAATQPEKVAVNKSAAPSKEKKR